MEAQECADIPRWRASDSADFKLIAVLQGSDSQHPAPALTPGGSAHREEFSAQHKEFDLSISPGRARRRRNLGGHVHDPTGLFSLDRPLQPCCSWALAGRAAELCWAFTAQTHSFNIHLCVSRMNTDRNGFIYICTSIIECLTHIYHNIYFICTSIHTHM